jgi:hypothetical protein
MAISIGEQFAVSKEEANTLLSVESPGLTPAQYEDLHMGDMRKGFADDAINAVIKTDGFKSLPACRAARRTITRDISSYLQGVDAATRAARDKK